MPHPTNCPTPPPPAAPAWGDPPGRPAAPPDLHRANAWLRAAAGLATAVLDDPFGDVQQELAAQACAAARADYASVLLPSAGGAEMTVVGACGPGADVYRGVTVATAGSALGRAVVGGDPLLSADVFASATREPDAPNPYRLGPAATLPLVAPDGQYGALLLCRLRGGPAFGADERAYADPFLELASRELRAWDVRTGAEPEVGERDLLSAELRDELTQHLFATGVMLETLRADVGPQAAARLQASVDDLDAMIVALRRHSAAFRLPLPRRRLHPRLSGPAGLPGDDGGPGR